MYGLPYNDEDGEERQASWYASFRKQIYRTIGLRNLSSALEIGCGTGVITDEIASRIAGITVGAELIPERASCASQIRDNAQFIAANGEFLPFDNETFDVVFFSFTLMWLGNPELVIREAKRVVQEGGYVIALAEPDYGALIDYPLTELSEELVRTAITGMGGDVCAGRKLRQWFTAAGLREQSSGTIPHRSRLQTLIAEEANEIAGLKRLLGDSVMAEDLRIVEESRKQALRNGSRMYFLPVFYLIARR